MSIKEIAKRTGASQATISRVLNNPDHRCSDPKLRDKIWKAAMELHYVPNEAARDLKHGKQGDNKKTYYLQVLVTRSDVGQSDPGNTQAFRACGGSQPESAGAAAGDCLR